MHAAGKESYSDKRAMISNRYWKQIELGEGRFALRAFSNQRFVRVVPPIPADDDNGWLFDWDVWTLEVTAFSCVRFAIMLCFAALLAGFLHNSPRSIHCLMNANREVFVLFSSIRLVPFLLFSFATVKIASAAADTGYVDSATLVYKGTPSSTLRGTFYA